MQFLKIENANDLPDWIDINRLADFLHDNLKPYEDSVEDIKRGINYALSQEPGKGGFVLLAEAEYRLMGVLVMLHTGMKRYVPANLLLFVAVETGSRGQGIGRQLCENAIANCQGDICLHVEYANPARRLYERLGFSSKYAEMRYVR